MGDRHIITRFAPKPIPDFRFDYEAYWSDDSSEGHHVGYGKTREEAIADLKRLDEELAESLDAEAIEKWERDNYGY